MKEVEIFPLAAQFVGQTFQVEMDPGKKPRFRNGSSLAPARARTTRPPTSQWDLFGDNSGFQPLTPNGDATFQLDHKYVAPGPYTVTVTALDLQGSLGSATASLAPRRASATPAPVTEGLTQRVRVTLSQAASFPVNVQFATQDGTASRARTIRSWTPRAGRSRSRRAGRGRRSGSSTTLRRQQHRRPRPERSDGLTYTVTATSSQPVFSPAVPATGVINPLDAVGGAADPAHAGAERESQLDLGGFVEVGAGVAMQRLDVAMTPDACGFYEVEYPAGGQGGSGTGQICVYSDPAATHPIAPDTPISPACGCWTRCTVRGCTRGAGRTATWPIALYYRAVHA